MGGPLSYIPPATERRELDPSGPGFIAFMGVAQPEASLSLTPQNYRPEIDGLRAIAVAAVVLYHADSRLMPGGFVGVDIFFVISGYLITGLLISEWRRAGRIDLAAFYARRVRRLFPALMTMVLLVMLVVVLVLGRHVELLEQTGKSAAASLLFFANIHFQGATGGYFDVTAESLPMLHLWSLSVEEQFYLLYPALVLVLLRYVPGGVGRRLAVLSLASLALAEYWVHILPEKAFFQMPARFWELAAGGMAAMSVVPAVVRPLDRCLAPAGILAVMLACWFTPVLGSFPGKGAVPAVIGATLVLLAIHRGATDGPVQVMLRSRPFVLLGLLSYSLYLWHWPILVIDHQLRLDPAPLYWRLLLCLAATALAWLSWRWIERPFRKRHPVPTRAVLASGAGATLLALAAVTMLARIDRLPSEARRLSAFARTDMPETISGCHFDYDEVAQGLKPVSCHSRPGVAPTVALWGDSHALAWQPFVWELAEARDQSAAAATMNSCHPSGLNGAGALSPESACDAMNRMAMAWLESNPMDVLVIGLRWPVEVSETGPLPTSLEESLGGLEAALGRLPHVGKILLMGPLPTLRQPAPDCVALGWELDCSRPRPEYERGAARVWKELHALASRYPNVELVDATDFFCGPVRCLVTRDGYVLYWDSNHISASASREFARQYLAAPARYTRRPSAKNNQVPVLR